MFLSLRGGRGDGGGGGGGEVLSYISRIGMCRAATSGIG